MILERRRNSKTLQLLAHGLIGLVGWVLGLVDTIFGNLSSQTPWAVLGELSSKIHVNLDKSTRMSNGPCSKGNSRSDRAMV